MKYWPTAMHQCRPGHETLEKSVALECFGLSGDSAFQEVPFHSAAECPPAARQAVAAQATLTAPIGRLVICHVLPFHRSPTAPLTAMQSLTDAHDTELRPVRPALGGAGFTCCHVPRCTRSASGTCTSPGSRKLPVARHPPLW